MMQVITPVGVAIRPEVLAIYHKYLGDALPPDVPTPPASLPTSEDAKTWDADDADDDGRRRLLDVAVDGLIPQRRMRRDADLARVRALEAAGTISPSEAAAQGRAIYDVAEDDISKLYAQKRAEIALQRPLEEQARRRARKALRAHNQGRVASERASDK